MSRKDTALRFFEEQKALTDVRVASGIELYRKGNAEIVVKSKDGSPLGDVTVTAEQKSHEFKFGANIFMLDEFETEEKNKIYREKFAEAFNLATVPFYWQDLEPERGKPRYAKDSPRVYRRPAPDLCVEYCKEKGIEPKCHCLNYDAFTPNWLVGATVEEHKNMLIKRFAEISERYAADLPSFEVTNETLQRCKSKFFYEDDFVEWSFRMADRFFPGNRLIINDYNIWWPESYNNRHPYYMQIERLIREGCRVDSIGMQYHSFFKREYEENIAAQRYNPETLYKMMDLYAKLGRAEQITEMTLPAYSGEEEDEWIQAELLRNTYRIFFSHPAMEAIIYWNLVDGYAYRAEPGDMTAGENVYYGGLIRFDMSEKPAFTMLKKLVNEEWHTSASIACKNGIAKLRGFYGDYKLTVHANGKSVPVDFTLGKTKMNRIEVVI